MRRRDSWDKFHRQEKVLRPDYHEEQQLKLRRNSRGTNIDGLLRRAEKSVQKEIDLLLGSVRWYGPNRRPAISSTPGSAFAIDQSGLGSARRRVIISSALSKWLAQNEIDNAGLTSAIRSLLAELERVKTSQHLRQLQERNVVMQFLVWNYLLNEAEDDDSDFGFPKMPDKLALWLLKFKKKQSASRSTFNP